MRTDEGDSRRFSWTADVRHGRYLATVDPPGCSWIIAHRRWGIGSPLLEVGPPVDVVLRVVDDRTGLPADVESVAWSPKQPVTWTSMTTRSTTWSGPIVKRDHDGAYRFTAPRGPIEVSVSGQTYGVVRSMLDIGERREHRIRVSSQPGFRLFAKDGDTVVRWSIAWSVGMTQVDGDGRRRSIAIGDKGTICLVSKAGTYRIDVSGLDEFEDPDPVIASTSDDGLVDVEFELQRR